MIVTMWWPGKENIAEDVNKLQRTETLHELLQADRDLGCTSCKVIGNVSYTTF